MLADFRHSLALDDVEGMVFTRYRPFRGEFEGFCFAKAFLLCFSFGQIAAFLLPKRENPDICRLRNFKTPSL
jgi:hypothetical protein